MQNLLEQEDARRAKKLFGTDGVRGPFGKSPLTLEELLRLGKALGMFVTKQSAPKPFILMGADPRVSKDLMQMSLGAGLLDRGVDIHMLGTLPTPALSFLTKTLRAPLGVMLSASHNGAQDNGIKIFKKNGEKLSEPEEREIEVLFNERQEVEISSLTYGKLVPSCKKPILYTDFLKKRFGCLDLTGKKIVLDCANGGMSSFARPLFTYLGAEVVECASSPNGRNINDGVGALFPQNIQKAVGAEGADLGLAFDGDGDRLVVCTRTGHVIEGDELLAFFALFMKEKGLTGNHVVSTVMANEALRVYLKAHGMSLERSPVGDKAVVEAMKQKGANLGGEPSGHILLRHLVPTSDGLVTSLFLLQALAEKQQVLHEVFPLLTLYPQCKKNLPLQPTFTKLPFQDIVRRIQQHVSPQTRIIVRPSGTEPILRLMTEAPSLKAAERAMDNLLTHLQRSYSAPLTDCLQR